MSVLRSVLIALAGAALASSALAAGPLDDKLAGWTGPGAPPHIDDVWNLVHGPTHPAGRRGTPPPLTEAAAAKLKIYMANPGHGATTANCIPPGMPQVMDVPYPIEILFAPGKIVIEEEGYMQVRHIHADGRPHPSDPDLTYNGDSISHWDGDTLVVDTIGLAPEVELAEGVGHGDKTHIVERFHLIAPDLLDVQTTVTDPAVLSKPWIYDTHFQRRHDWDIEEYVCQQNNHDFVDSSGRLGEKLN